MEEYLESTDIIDWKNKLVKKKAAALSRYDDWADVRAHLPDILILDCF